MQKIFKAYYGFQVLYVFPFPSAGHGPIGSGRDKVGIRALMSNADLWLIVLCLFLYYCGIRLSNVGSVILLLVFRVVSVSLLCFDFIWVVFSE